MTPLEREYERLVASGLSGEAALALATSVYGKPVLSTPAEQPSPELQAHRIASMILGEQLSALHLGETVSPAGALQRLKKRAGR